MSESPDNNELLNQLFLLAQAKGYRSPADIIREAKVEKEAKQPKRPKKRCWWLG